MAEEWANKISTKGHISFAEISGIGENITAFPTGKTAREMVDYWYKENSKYEYETPGWQAGTNYFTQIVWKATEELGVGCVRMHRIKVPDNKQQKEESRDDYNEEKQQQIMVVVAFYRFCKLPQNNEAKYDINRMEMDSSPSSSESNLTFAIEELHGEQTVLKEIVIPTKSNYSICQRQERRIADAESMCSSLYNFLVKLNSKLDKLCPAIHFPVKIICQNLSTIEATMSGNAFYD